jgi:hypothetical protein
VLAVFFGSNVRERIPAFKVTVPGVVRVIASKRSLPWIKWLTINPGLLTA